MSKWKSSAAQSQKMQISRMFRCLIIATYFLLASGMVATSVDAVDQSAELVAPKPGTGCQPGDSCAAPKNETSCSTCCQGKTACNGCCNLLPAIKQALCKNNCETDHPGGCAGCPAY